MIQIDIRTYLISFNYIHLNVFYMPFQSLEFASIKVYKSCKALSFYKYS